VHIGHGKLLQTARGRSQGLGAGSCALSFREHPFSLVSGRPVPLLCSQEERAALIRDVYGIPEVVLLPFDKALREMPWQDFVRDILHRRMEAVHLVAGDDFTFGYRGEGTPEGLREMSRTLSMGCDIVPPVSLNGVRVSSTYIRGLVAEGDMERAKAFLGHPYRLSGTVTRGKGLGRQMGFPTVNIPLPQGRQWPAFGVYATQVLAEGVLRPAVTNVGLRPTVADGGAPTVESTLLDWRGDLYGQPVEVLFHRFLRPERKFPSPEALRDQIGRDTEAARHAALSAHTARSE